MKKDILLKLICGAAISNSLISCNSGGNNASNPNTFNTQQTNTIWEACDQNKYGISKGYIDYYKDRLECSKVNVPLDYNDSSKGDIQIAVSRIKASNTSKKIGAMFFNPGGPGGRGIPISLGERRLSEIAKPGTELYQLSERYDYIGFDPRGVGKSTALICSLNSFYKPEMLATKDTSQENFDNIYQNQILDAMACGNNKLTPYINSDATARDMDKIREALGEKKLNYYGYSYGTWLGVWYASIFPENVDHMVLDSTVDFTQSLSDNSQSVPLQFVLDQLFIPYASQNDDKYNLGTDANEIRNIFSTLNLKLQTALSDKLYINLFYEDAARDDSLGYLMVAKVMNKEIKGATFNRISKEELHNKLVSYNFTKESEFATLLQTEIIPNLLDTYFKLVDDEPKLVNLQDDSVNKAVTCNDDNNSPTNPQYWNKEVLKMVSTAPAFFHDRYELNCTNKWGAKVKKPNTKSTKKIANILMVQSQYDPATPLAGALATYNKIGVASMVYKANSYRHGLFPSGNSCIDSSVTSYLLKPTTPSHTIVACSSEEASLPPLHTPNLKAINPSVLSYKNNVASLSSSIVANATIKADTNYLNTGFYNPKEASNLISEIHNEVIKANILKK
ncbi:MAG: alpha/beta fold hydrolase [Burkholderiales bacterium]|nr:alpha/beta fold hydrolase [Burkholderiales bacterium]